VEKYSETIEGEENTKRQRKMIDECEIRTKMVKRETELAVYGFRKKQFAKKIPANCR